MDQKAEILSKIDFIEEYENVGLTFDSTEPNAGGWVPCHAFDRDDRNASAAVNVQNGFYTDLGGSGQKYDFFAMMQLLGKFNSFGDAMDYYRQKFGLEKPLGRPKKTPEQEVDFLPWNGNGDRWCGLKKTTREAVERAGGTLCRYKGRYICIGFQVFAKPELTKTTASGYVVAQTNGQGLPKFDAKGNYIGEAKYKLVAGTQSGLIGTEALLTIEKARETGTLDELTLFKVEGVSDLTSLLSRIPDDKRGKWLVLTNAGGAGEKPKPTWADAFAGVRVVIIHDSDKPGQAGAKEWCRYLHGLATEVKNVVLPYPETPDHGKDLKDFLTEHSPEDFFQLVENTPVATIEKTAISKYSPDNPHRIAIEFLERKYRLPHTEIYTLVYQQSTYYQWQQGCYEYLPTESLQADLTRFCNALFEEDHQAEYAAWEALGLTDKPPVVRKASKRLVADVLNEVCSMVITDCDEEVYWRGDEIPEEYQDVKQLIPLKNGVLHVGKLQLGQPDYLLKSTPYFFNRNVLPVEFDPCAPCENWIRMVEANLRDDDGGWSKLSLFQEFMGYCLVPDTSLQKFLLCVGEGSNGKSAVMAGFYAMIGARNAANLSLEMFSDKFALHQLRGKLVNIVDDMSETDKVCEGKLKSVVSGMSIHTDRKNKTGINFTPTARLIFCCNNPPKFQDKSNGILRRLLMVSFNRTIAEHERNPDFCDVHFWEKEAAGIFNWCVAGLIRLRKNGNKLTVCKENEKIKQEYIYEINSAAAFISEMVEAADDYIICKSLYKFYSGWCYDNGMKPLNHNNFGRELRRKFDIKKEQKWTSSNKREYVYSGIQYKQGVVIDE